MYQKSIQKFIASGGTTPTLIECWIKKINALNQKKSTYEDILRQRLDNLDKDYALLKMQAQELIVRNNKSQIKVPLERLKPKILLSQIEWEVFML